MIKLNKVLGLVLGLAVVTLGLTATNAQAAAIGIEIDNNIVKSDVAPYIENGRTMVPVAVISRELGADVKWDAEYRRITITRGNTIIKLLIDDTIMEVGADAVALDAPATIKQGRTMVPLAAIADAFGCTVSWNDEIKIVEIYTPAHANMTIGSIPAPVIETPAVEEPVVEEPVMFPYVEKEDANPSLPPIEDKAIYSEKAIAGELPPPPANPKVTVNPTDYMGTVKEVLAGGMFLVDFNGSNMYVELSGIVLPDVPDQDDVKELRKRYDGKAVKVVRDTTSGTNSHYFVYLDGELLNYTIIKDGLGELDTRFDKSIFYEYLNQAAKN